MAAETVARLKRTRDLIAHRCDEQLQLKDLAYEACLSPFHYHRLFTSTFNQTPHEFLTQQRIDKAKKLLTQTDQTVLEICFELGYSSPGSFCTLFQRSTGCTPTQYREGVARFYAMHRVWSHRFVPTCFLRNFS